MRKLLILTTAVFIASFCIFGTPQPAKAISSGCSTINGHSETDYPIDGYVPGNLAFEDGETIVYRVIVPDADSVSAVIYDLAHDDYLAIATALGTTAIATYIIPENGNINIAFHYSVTGTHNLASLSIECGRNVPGPAIPEGSTLHSISCTTAVYAAPGGAIVEGAVVTAGQSWFIDAAHPIADATGKLWVKIFVSSYNAAYVPMDCVAGAAEVAAAAKSASK